MPPAIADGGPMVRGQKLSIAAIGAAAERYRSGTPAHEIAAELGVGERTLRRHFARLGVSAGSRRGAVGPAGAAPPEGWSELVSAIVEPPDDAMQWAGWARRQLTRIAMFYLRNPEMAPLYHAALAEFRQAIKGAAAARQEDLVYDAIELIKSDVKELEGDAGPEIVGLPARRHRRDRKREED